MPNWCYNEMTITADTQEAQKQARELMKCSIVKVKEKNYKDEETEVEKFTFNGVHPMPESLKITSGSSVEDAVCLLKARKGDLTGITEYAKREWTHSDASESKLYSKDTPLKEKIKIAMDHLEDTLEVNAITEGEIAMDNLEKYGFQDWYNWSIHNWGTKWDACNSHIESDDGDYIFITFDTAWSPPEPWIEKLTKKFPLLEIQVRVTEESNAFMGYICASDGQTNASYAEPRMPQ